MADHNNKGTILLIDSKSDKNPSYLDIFQSIFSHDLKIKSAKTGNDGISLALNEKPDLIFLGIMGSDMTGLDTLKELKKSRDTKNIPVIVFTDKDNEKIEEKSLNLGAVDYISEPFSGVIVKARVYNQLQIIRQMRTIEQISLLDPLTNIRNRRSFNDRLNTEWRRCLRDRSPLSFMMVDVDKFKQYNDTYGHPQGDTLLKALAMIFEASARRPADLIARLGGEEFGILLPNTPIKPAMEIAEIIRTSVELLRVMTADGVTETRTTISIGVAALVPAEGLHSQDLIEKADQLLYEAKTTGRNRVCSESN